MDVSLSELPVMNSGILLGEGGVQLHIRHPNPGSSAENTSPLNWFETHGTYRRPVRSQDYTPEESAHVGLGSSVVSDSWRLLGL